MDPRESLYLDLIRALAALFVVIDHAPTIFVMPNAPRWGHQAVVVFFVLSGYVISHVADTREPTARAFLVARFARLWSVLVPAIILTVACDTIGRRYGIEARAYADVPHDLPLIRIGAVLLFLSETWVSIQPLSNGVVWSLCAEFWYYALFAAWTFLLPGWTRRAALFVLALLSGFKALLLLPIWLMGVTLQRWAAPRRWSGVLATVVWLAGGLAIAWVLATHAYNPPIDWMHRMVGSWVSTQLAQSRVFWLDWMLGLAVAANFAGARRMAAFLPPLPFAPVIRWAAGVSFAAYLFHMPLLHLCAAFLPPSYGWLAVTLTLGAIALLGTSVERTKRWWHRRLDSLLDLVLESRLVAGALGGRLRSQS